MVYEPYRHNINDNRPRPLEVILSSKEISLHVITDFNADKRSCNPDNPASSISFSRDRTSLELRAIRRVYSELEK